MESKSSDGSENLEAEIVEYSNSSYPRFNDVFGTEDFKTQLEDIVLSMVNSSIYLRMGAKPPQSWLFTGPPGVGKTFTVKAIANELAVLTDPKQVVLMPYDIGRYGTAYINMGSVTLQKFFDSSIECLLEPNVHSVILQFDECDTIMSKRGSSYSHKEDDKLLETLMKNLQTINSEGLPIYTFFMTNFKDALDPAAIRSGRIDREVEFKLPNYDARKQLFSGYINKFNNAAGYQVIRNVDLDELAEKSKGMNCADIEAILDLAIDNKIREEIRNKPEGVIPAYYITHKRVADALYELSKRKKPVEYKKQKIGFI